MVVLILWVFLEYKTPGRFRPLWEFTSTAESKPFPELLVPTTSGREDVYKLRPGTRSDYRVGGLTSGKSLPTRPTQITVLEGSEKSIFKPERDDKGNFKQRTVTRMGRETKEPLRYLDEKGRVMYEDSLGELATTFKTGWFIGNLFVNLLFLAVWFVAFWLLLQFQWPHALGQAIVMWLVAMMFVLPFLLTRAEQTARQRAAAATSAITVPLEVLGLPGTPT
jgi:hypothetical protein